MSRPSRGLVLSLATWTIASLIVPPKSWIAATGFSALALSRPVSVVRFAGEGRHKFLHGLCTAQVDKGLRAGGLLEAAVVDGSGTVNNLLTLVDTPDAILALGPAGRGTEQAAFFDKYAFPADKCAIEDVSHAFRCFEVVGPDAAKVVRIVLEGDWELPGVGQCVPSTDCYVYGGGSLGYAPSQVPVYSLILSSGSADGIAMSLAEAVSVAGGIFAKGEDAWDSLRVLRGRPDNGAEFAPPPVKTAAAATAEPAFAAPMADSPPPTIPKATPFDLGLWSTVHLDKVLHARTCTAQAYVYASPWRVLPCHVSDARARALSRSLALSLMDRDAISARRCSCASHASRSPGKDCTDCALTRARPHQMQCGPAPPWPCVWTWRAKKWRRPVATRTTRGAAVRVVAAAAAAVALPPQALMASVVSVCSHRSLSMTTPRLLLGSR